MCKRCSLRRTTPPWDLTVSTVNSPNSYGNPFLGRRQSAYGHSKNTRLCVWEANVDLGFSVAFPIIGSLPGVVGLIVGMAFFGEAQKGKPSLGFPVAVRECLAQTTITNCHASLSVELPSELTMAFRYMHQNVSFDHSLEGQTCPKPRSRSPKNFSKVKSKRSRFWAGLGLALRWPGRGKSYLVVALVVALVWYVLDSESWRHRRHERCSHWNASTRALSFPKSFPVAPS